MRVVPRKRLRACPRRQTDSFDKSREGDLLKVPYARSLSDIRTRFQIVIAEDRPLGRCSACYGSFVLVRSKKPVAKSRNPHPPCTRSLGRGISTSDTSKVSQGGLRWKRDSGSHIPHSGIQEAKPLAKCWLASKPDAFSENR